MKVVLVIERITLLLWGYVSTRHQGEKRYHSKRKKLWQNTLKEKDLKVAVNLRAIEALMKKKRSFTEKVIKKKRHWNNETIKLERKSIGDIQLLPSQLSWSNDILMRVKIEAMRQGKHRFQINGSIIKNLNYSWVSQITQGRLSVGWPLKNSAVCGTNCVAAGTSIEVNYLLQKNLRTLSANKLPTVK